MNSMKTILFILAILLAAILPVKESKAQVFEIKTWPGLYPEMNGSYPLTFVAFKGTLIPMPYVFVKLWPTHYYLQSGALQVIDAGQMSKEMKIGLLKIAEKFFEKSQMIKRHEETTQIKNNTERRRDISKTIFDAQFDQLPDVYQISAGFVRLYGSINKMKKLNEISDCTWLVKTYQKEADDLLLRFVSINLFEADHGKKIEAFSQVRKELSGLMGETDYTYRKVHHYQFYANDVSQSYSFLAQ